MSLLFLMDILCHLDKKCKVQDTLVLNILIHRLTFDKLKYLPHYLKIISNSTILKLYLYKTIDRNK